ncbi:MAG TPA: hypothetical protein VNU46_06235, partial [Gemmatimonadaceae bacterium]|nr:hypothetical protein [Gemmatimonadaceae bacterium]
MKKYIRSTWIPAVASLVVVAACSGDKKADTAAQDSTLNQNLQTANGDTSVKPQLADTATSAPATSAPTGGLTHEHHRPMVGTTRSGNTYDRTPVNETPLGTIPAGSTLSLSSNSRVCTNTNHVGDQVTANVSNTVTGSNGAAIPAGATATLAITTLKRSENVND